jgi:hypothetical protein
MQQKSQSIRRDFSSHRPAAGHNREAILADFLREHLPARFGTETGLVISPNGQFSNQADLAVTDALLNKPLYPSSPERLLLVESVYALVEVKTTLTPTEISDSIAKCRRFKQLPRRFLATPHPLLGPLVADSLFVIFSYDAPSAQVLKTNLLNALSGVPRDEHPDFVVVLGKYVVRGGSYLELSKLGQPGSPHRQALIQQHGADLEKLLSTPIEMDDFHENTLFSWFIWFQSWLKHAGPRQADLLAYLPPAAIFGHSVP